MFYHTRNLPPPISAAFGDSTIMPQKSSGSPPKPEYWWGGSHGFLVNLEEIPTDVAVSNDRGPNQTGAIIRVNGTEVPQDSSNVFTVNPEAVVSIEVDTHSIGRMWATGRVLFGPVLADLHLIKSVLEGVN
jgi:hypothetical protein